MEYFGVPQEAPAVVEKSRPPAYWPSSNGELVVDDLVVRYAPGLPAVLRNLTFTIKPSEKIGVVNIPFSSPLCNPHHDTHRWVGQGQENQP